MLKSYQEWNVGDDLIQEMKFEEWCFCNYAPISFWLDCWPPRLKRMFLTDNFVLNFLLAYKLYLIHAIHQSLIYNKIILIYIICLIETIYLVTWLSTKPFESANLKMIWNGNENHFCFKRKTSNEFEFINKKNLTKNWIMDHGFMPNRKLCVTISIANL